MTHIVPLHHSSNIECHVCLKVQVFSATKETFTSLHRESYIDGSNANVLYSRRRNKINEQKNECVNIIKKAPVLITLLLSWIAGNRQTRHLHHRARFMLIYSFRWFCFSSPSNATIRVEDKEFQIQRRLVPVSRSDFGRRVRFK